MHVIFRKEEKAKAEEQMNFPDMPEKRPTWQSVFHFCTLVLILVFANWGKPANGVTEGAWYWLWVNKWYVTSGFAVLLVFSIHTQIGEVFSQTNKVNQKEKINQVKKDLKTSNNTLEVNLE